MRLELASLYFSRGQFNTALDEIKLALQADPNNGAAHSLSGLIYAAMGNMAQADASFQRALQLNPGDADTMNNYGWVLCQNQRYAEAVQMFARALAQPNYRGTARTCVGCHQAQYNATRNPNHGQVGYGTSCDTCHRPTDTSWQQGSFNHTRFPLRGQHNVSCAQCHTGGNYPAFSCTVCHDRGETDKEHRGRSGYTYDSRACYSCHPNGR